MKLFGIMSSIRGRLIVMLLIAAAILSGLLYYAIRTVAETAVEQTQDRILGSAALAIAEEVRGGQDGVEIDIPYSAFSMLGATGNERVFYRIDVSGIAVTGYDGLETPQNLPRGVAPEFYSSAYEGETVRIAAVSRAVLVAGQNVPVLVLVAQTRTEQAQIVERLANRAAGLGLGFFVVAAVLAVLTARAVIQPVNNLADAVTRRGPQDLRPVVRQVPDELRPMVNALNGFIGRLSGALSRTETFIAEAAHYIRTPLTTLRAQSDIALHHTDDPKTKEHLRKIIRLADDTARSAGQLLDHAAVVYRTDQRNDQQIDVGAMAKTVVHAFRPSAELREIKIRLNTDDSKTLFVFADPILLETVMRNLLDNGIKYSWPDQTVVFRVGAKGGYCVIEITDTGRGLDGQTTGDLTRRHARGSNVGDVVGSGLGLAIVNEVASAYGGSFELKSSKKGETCARFTLPLA